MRRRLLVTGACLMLLGSFAMLGVQLDPFLAADACLASGGSYDFAGSACDFARAHAADPFPMWSFWAGIGGVWAGMSLFGQLASRNRRRARRTRTALLAAGVSSLR